MVVLATGLGKTWLAAFDCFSGDFGRVLFVAHREEILTQAMETFRRIRPQARLGMYTGLEKTPNANVLFASIQTLGRMQHLSLFAPDYFDYVVVDKFHHASAGQGKNFKGVCYSMQLQKFLRELVTDQAILKNIFHDNALRALEGTI